MGKKLQSPPNLRASQSCGTCAHWTWGYEGEGDCARYPNRHDKRTFAPIHLNSSTFLCDDYKAPENKP